MPKKSATPPEHVADVFQLAGGRLLLRPRFGRTLRLTILARTIRQPDGTFILSPLPQEIETAEARKILGIPETTLRRLIETGKIIAYKRSPRRWTVDLASVLNLKECSQSDRDYWDCPNPVPSAALDRLLEDCKSASLDIGTKV